MVAIIGGYIHFYLSGGGMYQEEEEKQMPVFKAPQNRMRKLQVSTALNLLH